MIPSLVSDKTEDVMKKKFEERENKTLSFLYIVVVVVYYLKYKVHSYT